MPTEPSPAAPSARRGVQVTDSRRDPAPRFSVIVPCYNVREWLPACLDSVLGQESVDLELIAVDDASPDGLIEILQEYARTDARVRVVRLEENVGLGLARNAGLEHARGDYVVFLDSDDTFTPGALAAIDARLRAVDDPDVLVFDYAKTWDDGRVESDPRHSAAVGHDGPTTFVAGERRDLLGIFMVVWNKAYRRDFLTTQGFAFFPGFYEDLTWTYEALLTASTIATTPTVVVHYRQRPAGGNILATTTRRHFEVFDQYDRLFDWLDERPQLAANWHAFLYDRMLDQALAILANPERIGPDARRDFFVAAHDAATRHRPRRYEPTPGRRGFKRSLLMRGRWRTYALGATGAATVRRLKGEDR